MRFVCKMATVFRSIYEEQAIISNLLQIKDFHLLSSIMDFVSRMVK
jgi:hypothetical protein